MKGPLRVTTLVASLALVAACVAPSGPSTSTSPYGVGPVVIQSPGEGALPPDQEHFYPAVEALRDAVLGRDEEEARRILTRLKNRAPGEEVLALMDAFERILDGRTISGRIDTSIIAREVAETPGDYRLVLRLESHESEDLRLQPAGIRLCVSYTAVDPLGSAQSSVQFVNVDGLERIELTQHAPKLLELVEITLPNPPGMLAIDAHFQLEFLATEIVVAGRSLPGADLALPELSIVRLAGYLPNGSMEPAELARYVGEREIRQPALMERAVRIVPERRGEALDLLAPMVERMSTPDLAELAPALRWLTGAKRPGGDPEAWRDWMAARTRGEERRADKADGRTAGAGLDLPIAR